MLVVGNRVMIAPNERRTSTDSGLILPPSAQEDAQIGLVLAVGFGRYSEKSGKLIPIEHIGPGDLVLYSKYGGTTIEVEGEEMLLMDPENIFCIVNDVTDDDYDSFDDDETYELGGEG